MFALLLIYKMIQQIKLIFFIRIDVKKKEQICLKNKYDVRKIYFFSIQKDFL